MLKNNLEIYNQFKPDLTPRQMLELGVFGGAYFSNADLEEYPKNWLVKAKISDHGPDKKFNYFKTLAGQSHSVWQKKGWIHEIDPKGWFQWYCRFYMGRRLLEEDIRQIKRWLAMKRHISQVKLNCIPGDIMCRPKQRQALLQWAYDSRKI